MYKFRLNNEYKVQKDFLLNIREYFQQSDNSIHKARNEIKIIDGLVVKSFKNPNFIKKLIYKFIPSKAKRSYEYSLRLKEFAPTPIGYIEFYKNGFLKDSYFVSEEFKYDFTIREPLLDKNFPNKEEIFKEFAHFTFKLHSNGILHKDYSPGNILIKKDKNGYIFKIVDVNRMEFRQLLKEERLKNFDKLWAKDEDLEVIVKEYAKVAGYDEKEAIKSALYYSQKLKDFKNMKKRIKGIEVVD
jgi:serine/threonine protein kinase